MVSLEHCGGDLASLGQWSALDSCTGGLWSAQSKCMSTFGDAGLIGPSCTRDLTKKNICAILPPMTTCSKPTTIPFAATTHYPLPTVRNPLFLFSPNEPIFHKCTSSPITYLPISRTPLET